MEDSSNNKNSTYDPAKESKLPQGLKKRRVKKLNTILKKEPRVLNNGVQKERKASIKWDNQAIESQTRGKNNKKYSDELKRISSTRYKNYISKGEEEEEDEYLQNLLKVIENTEDIKVFDGVKDDESKLTLKNTFINKFHKEFIGNGNEFYSDQDLKLI